MNESQTAPVVLVHGVLGFNRLMLGSLNIADYFRLIPNALRNDGHVVPEPPRLNPAGSVAERAQDLTNYLQDRNNVEVLDKKVHIVAHSMGGLDARFAISKLGMADRVLSLTTIATPHHGSPIADKVAAGTDPALNQFIEHLGIDIKALVDLRTDVCRQFNNEVLDAPGVRYFSIAGEFEPPRSFIFRAPQGLLGPTHDIIAKREKANDGLVSVTSATFAERPAWTLLDGWEANHFREINWGMNLIPSPLELADHSIVEKYRSLVNRIKQLMGSIEI
ncbi:MAG: alpha/beta fold hydrolase [bacterium]